MVTQHPSKDAAAKIVQYYRQNNSFSYISCTDMSKMIFGSNDTKNWFGQTGQEREIDIIWVIG